MEIEIIMYLYCLYMPSNTVCFLLGTFGGVISWLLRYFLCVIHVSLPFNMFGTITTLWTGSVVRTCRSQSSKTLSIKFVKGLLAQTDGADQQRYIRSQQMNDYQETSFKETIQN